MKLQGITLFDSIHLGYIFGSIVFCIAVPFLGKFYCHNPDSKKRWVMGLIWFTVVQEVFDYFNRLQVRELNLELDLPLHLCHIALLASTIALYNKNVVLFESAYFWGIGASFQAILTPDMSDFDNNFSLVTFYLHHALIIAHVLWLIVVEKMRCRKGSVLRTMLITNIFAVIIYPINLVIGGKANYMYLIDKPPVNNPLLMGEWPWYILNLEIIIILYMGLLYIPFFLKNLKSTKLDQT